jgi:hypothetical protein
MWKIRAALAAFVLALGCAPALAQSAFGTPGGAVVNGNANMCPNGAFDFQGRPVMVPCSSSAALNLTASTTATTGAFSASLTPAAGKTASFCGFVITSGGTTTAEVVNVTVAGLGATLNYAYVFPSSGQGVLGIALPQCIPASAPNTAITVSVPAGGTGTTAALTVWGNQQ